VLQRFSFLQDGVKKAETLPGKKLTVSGEGHFSTMAGVSGSAFFTAYVAEAIRSVA
jgi:hypothetical protein